MVSVSVSVELVEGLERAVAALEKSVQAPPSASASASVAELNNQRRRLHAEVELARASQPAPSPEFEARLAALVPRLSLATATRGFSPGGAFRALLAFFFILSVFPVMVAILWTRFFHSAARRLGVPTNSLPLDIFQRWLCRGIIRIMGVTVVCEGAEGLDLENASVGMFSHASNLDALLVAAVSPVSFRWIGKKSAFLIPVLGWFAWALGMIPINRANREKAIRSLEQAATSIRDRNRSVTIAPEGKRSPTGQLLEFKKGPFYLATGSGAKISPIIIFGAYELWPPNQTFPCPGQVVVRFLKPTAPTPHDADRDALLRDTRAIFLKACAEPPLPKLLKSSDAQSLNAFADWTYIAVCLFSSLWLANKAAAWWAGL